MKKINLNQLSMSWNEKQMPQKFRRYAGMLIMLLTLGAGQMWADCGYNGEEHVYLTLNGTTKYYQVRAQDSWSTGVTLPGTWGGVLKDQTFNNVLNLQIAGGAVGGWTTSPSTLSGTLYYAVTTSSSTPGSWTSFGSIASTGVWNGGSNCFYYKNNGTTNVTPTTPGTYYLHIKITNGGSTTGTSYVKFTVPSFTVAGDEAVLGSDWDETDTDNDMTWSSSTTYSLTKSNVTLSTGTTYECKVVVNHNWSDGSYPGSNKQFTVAANGHYNVTFTFDASSQAVNVSTTRLYAVTYSGNSPTTGTAPATTYHANGATVTVASNSGSLAKTGYDFGGWNTNSSGTGTNYTAGSGTFTMGSADKPLYAKWNKKKFTVTVNNDGNGTTSPSGAQSNIAQVDGVAISATPDDGYEFTNWTIVSGSGTFTGGGTTSTSASTTFYPTSAATIRANFSSTATSTLTVTATAGGSITTPAAGYYSDISEDDYDIEASRSEGYKFTGWSKTAGDGAVTFGDASSLSTTATVTTVGDVTVTAGFAAMSNALSVSSSTLYAGDNITLTATRTNHSLNLTYQYKIGSGSWTDIATQSGTSKTWQIPYANTYQTYKFRVKSTDGSTDIVSSEQTVTVKGRITIHVKNTNSWATMYLYSWYNDGSDHTTNGAWPGATGSGSNQQSCSIHATGSLWWDVTITQETATAQEFILNKNGSNNQDKTDDLSLSDFTHDAYYAMSTNGSAVQTLSPATAPAAPTATTNDANNITSTSVVFNYSVSANRDKTTPGIAFKQSDDDIDAATIYSSGTKVAGSATNGNASGSTAAQTITPGKKYYYVAYGTNGFGTSYGTVKSFVAPYKVTITQPTGCSAITPGTGTQYVHIGDEISSTAATGYTFSSWSVTNVTLSSPTTTTGVTRSTITAAAENGTIAPAYTENMTTVNLVASPAGKGTFTSSEEAVISVSAGVDTHPTVTAVPAEGYHLTGTIWSESSDYISISPANTAATTITATGTTGNSADLTATFTPNTYRVQFHRNGAPEATVYQNFTYDVAQNLTANTYTRTGYTFGGWATSKERADAGNVDYTNGQNVNNLTSTNGATFHLYAKWTANNYTVVLDKQTSAEGYGGNEGTVANQTVTFDATPATVSGTMPSAAQGYGFMGFYSATGGNGRRFIDPSGNWVTSAGDTISGGHWVKPAGITLYAYYKKAEISLALDKSTAAPWSDAHPDSITVTPTIYPTPVGSPRICWTILQNNDNPVAEQPTFRNLSGSRVRFATKYASGNYKVAAVLRIGGSNCEDGTVLDADTVNFIIAGNHTVTIQYKYGTNVIRAASSETVGALDSVAITAPEITGYTFSYWSLGEGVFSNKAVNATHDTVASVNPLKVVATYDATLTANYSKKNMIYFNNTLGWDTVYVYFYSSDKYWDNTTYGTGANYEKEFTKDEDTHHRPHYRHFWGGMTKIGSSNVYYFDYEDSISNSSWNAEIRNYTNVAFTKDPQGYGYGADGKGFEWFYQTSAVRRGDYAHSIPMFVPLTTKTDTKNQTNYYSNGYWMNYPESTGYTLKIYSGTDKSKSDEIHSIPFEFTEDMTMPMELTVELNAATTYGFEIYRNDGSYYGNNATMQSGDSGDDGQTIWQFETGRSQRAGLLTSAAGDYTFKLSYGKDQQVTPAYNYLVGVHYPAGLNDYRIVYNDRVAWSQSTSHDASWYHPSRTIHKENGATDIVSFYVSKAEGANASMKFQYVSAINAGTGAVTWTDSTGGAISAVDTISKSGVYNFHLSQANGTITVSKVEPYDGNYYIRTDYAGTTGWDFYRASDHKMTYTEFSKNSSTNTFGDLFSHYYAHWCERSHNIKFTVANDYSSCISDTLENDLTDFNNMSSGAWLKTDGSGEAYQDIYSANIRFMYNDATNKISRAYVSSSTHTTRRFLVLAGTSDLKDANGNAIPKTANLEANAVLFNDDQNFMYEVTVKAIPGARVKLYAKYVETSQYFRGIDDGGDFDDPTNTIELIGGGGGTPQKVKVVYDFKTNRLVTAWEPDGTDIEGTLAINADVMINRDHQGSGEAITFGTNGKLDEVKTVYGTMTFNRWILNNRANPEDMTPESCADAAAIAANHPVLPVADQKSIYDRSLYFLSFPFDVKLSEVFGFGHYWDEWYIEYYDGLTRARNGFWADSDPNWKYVMPEDVNDFVLRANEGYILGLDLDYMKADNFNFWTNKSSQVVLYFPSTANIESITSTAVTLPALGDEYKCTINRGTAEGDRRVKDSYWRCIGVPGYSSYNQTLTTDDKKTITWQTSTEWHADLEDYPFLYEWNSTDNTLTPQSTSNYAFKPMHAYLVQNRGIIHWSAISATPVSPIVARQNTGTAINYNWCLTLERNGVLEDKTHIRMTNSETVTDGFDFGPDMSKEFNAKRSDIYTLIGYERAAANSMPIHESQTTIIPVGVSIETTGEYTFAMPEGTHGVGVKLNDTETGTQTNLSAGLSYTLTLNKGDYTNRFFIEISPVQGATTDVEAVMDDGLQVTGARKVIIDQKLFIIKGDKMYDARGAMVK